MTEESEMLIQIASINYETGQIQNKDVDTILSETLDSLSLSESDISKLDGIDMQVAIARKGIIECTIKKLNIQETM